jgi:hypothetical protein
MADVIESRPADRITAAARFHKGGASRAGVAGMGGDILGNILSGNRKPVDADKC